MRFGTGGDARPRGAGWERLNILVGEAIVGALRRGGDDAIVGLARFSGALAPSHATSCELV